MLEKIGVTPLNVMDILHVSGAALQSGMLGSYVAYMLGVGATSLGTTMGPHGAVITGSLLISNPVGWAVVLGSAAIGGGWAYRYLRKNK